MQAVVFMGFFAAAWWVAGFMSGHPFTALAAVGPATSAAMILAARARFRNEPPVDAAEKKRRARTVGWAAGVEAVAIVITVNLLNRNGLGAYIFPAIALIVGLHFLPLAKLLPVKVYYLSAALLVAVAAAGLAVDAADRPLLVGVSSAIVLWLTCMVRAAKAPTPSAA